MFSITSFQVDHYTNIIFPFAAIMCAKLLCDCQHRAHKIFAIQQWLAIVMLALEGVLIGLLFKHGILITFVVIEIIIVFLLVKFWGQTTFIKAILISFSAICLLYLFAMTANGYLYHQYDTGSIAAQVTNQNPTIPVVDYITDSRSLEFYAQGQYYKVNQLTEAESLPQYYLVIPDSNWLEIESTITNHQFVAQIKGNTDDKVIPNLGNSEKLANNLKLFDIILVKNK